MDELRTTRSPWIVAALAVLLATSGCSVRKLAVEKLADSLAEPGDVYTSDDDPELVREALPFGLKTMETLLAEAPEHGKLLLGTCRGFASYAGGFVEPEAEELSYEDHERAEELRERALKLFLRARGYCLRALELRHPGIGDELLRDPRAAAARAGVDDVELLYWTGGSWGAAIALALDQPEISIDLPSARALVERALELEPGWGRGAIHEAMISVEALPEAMGGSVERARHHFERAKALSEGRRASPFVTWAAKVSVPAQDYGEFREMLERALEVDPDAVPEERLANLIAQARARFLLEHSEDLFLVTEAD